MIYKSGDGDSRNLVVVRNDGAGDLRAAHEALLPPIFNSVQSANATRIGAVPTRLRGNRPLCCCHPFIHAMLFQNVFTYVDK